ncbi:YqaJ viral recombinase family protein [Borrelia coriaceae]
MTNLNKNKVEVKMEQLSLCNQKNISKINKVGRKLPKIAKSEYFKFNSKVDFSVQRKSLRRMGASEVGSMFIGTEHVSRLAIERVLKAIDREIPFKDNLSMRKGKVLENLAFDEFVRIYSDNIEVLYKNKYANGIDKYNYFKKYGKKDNLIGSTIDGWFINKEGESELLEIKCSDSIDLRSAVIEYNKTGNFLENKYFFKYYVQVQVQLACTGLSKGNLFFIIGNDAINCVIDRNDAFISKVMFGIEKLESRS